MSRLPEQFLWGTAVAAHQVEGGNVNSDCWALEHASPSVFVEPSGAACDHWNRYEEDIALVAQFGLNAFRFSVEWARVEPEPGVFSTAALDHYARVVDACRELSIVPVVTFHHFTQPRWMAALGGFAARDFPARFAAYCARAARAFDGIGLACTINELNLPVSAAAYFQSRASDAHRAAAQVALGAPLDAFFLFTPADAILGNGLEAHRLAREAIRAERVEVPVGMTLAISEETADPGIEDRRDARRERFYAPFLDAACNDDFVGVQTYARTHSRADGSGPLPGAPVTTMGWEDRPLAIGAVCQWIGSRWNVPLIVTENGYPGFDDARREVFITTALAGVRSAMADGADVRGYFYWSLLDNFEWMLGYRQRFGLVEVQADMRRAPKRSARSYRSQLFLNSCPDLDVR
ncbi:glycoside hydrolase family 1 protein [Novosphingobium sp. Gsoil 351]|uniref:glycoside hydrolase family 1 protein n=1 Tax=Novosphingobium sp. Gsoil 351 TaxID=2675225 RepID=UPI0012B4B7DB|nr:family 1 glycosylhydrolase [Novosphingobium sp. Gsoil 351]QGN55678.1 family 1 glycosylhydrolase [Novosphingobium sp. Gsoil 351]